MLNWFVDRNVMARVVNSDDLVEEEEVEVRPEKIPRKCLDENICINQIRKYCTFDEWKLIEQVIETMQKKGSWTCGKCSVTVRV